MAPALSFALTFDENDEPIRFSFLPFFSYEFLFPVKPMKSDTKNRGYVRFDDPTREGNVHARKIIFSSKNINFTWNFVLSLFQLASYIVYTSLTTPKFTTVALILLYIIRAIIRAVTRSTLLEYFPPRTISWRAVERYSNVISRQKDWNVSIEYI